MVSSQLDEIASKYVNKGSKPYIEGSLRTGKWKDQNGIDREVTEISADVLQLL
ncbi:single-stranded DNA-binding protein [Acinetobacter higginsii]|uniref:single-stranded DNA-binding protein n=1 Tax=Acinetobacter higginsii TaxID=70347 RepID=UPI001D17AEAE|nr:single-stranded DNA-binding protein [Acinetobacter higginsii]